MKKIPKVLVSVSAYTVPAGSQSFVFGVRQGVVDIINQIGAIPLNINAGMNPTLIRQMYAEADGVLFLGGHDISPALYGGEIPLDQKILEPERDFMELDLMRQILKDKKPFIGICRGMQMLNIACGGTLYTDITPLCKEGITHGIGTANATQHNYLEPTIDITIDSDSKLAQSIKEINIKAVCNHHQAVHKVGDGLMVNATSTADNIVEGIEVIDRGHFCFGIESHPEADKSNTFSPLFASFARSMQALV